MLIVYCGDLRPGGTCRMRLEALRRIGHTVIPVPTTPRPGLSAAVARLTAKVGWGADTVQVNQRLVQSVRLHRPQVVWIDKGLCVRTETLSGIRRFSPGTQIVHYSLDDMSGSHNQSRQYLAAIPLYDLHVTNKTYNVDELKAVGAREVLFVNNAFCPETHRPVNVSEPDRLQLGGPVGFIGAFERQRAEAISFLTSHQMPVRVWGEAWGKGWTRWAAANPDAYLRVESGAVFGDDYAKAISSFEINLCFLRKLNRDRQTTRTIEIPACGGFMLAERTQEHQVLFEEGVEAEFFDDTEELASKCRYYLSRPDIRLKIAAAGRRRCLLSGYSYDHQVNKILLFVKPALRTDVQVDSATAVATEC